MSEVNDPMTDANDSMSAPASATPFVVSALDALDPATRARLMERRDAVSPEIVARVRGILARVRAEGDAALRALTRELDGVALESFEVPRVEIEAAAARVDARARAALAESARAIRCAHTAFRPRELAVEVAPGVTVARRPDPLARVGVYAPGGRARYPSSVLMGAVPARVAGVEEIVLCTPPGRDGAPADIVLAAAAIAGVDRVFALGGAQAIAAMAYGTQSVPRADAIVGPGNAWVAEAKRQIAGEVRVDAPAGPSELLVIVEGADPGRVALELVAQAEHDPLAAALAVVVGEAHAHAVAAALADAAANAVRRDVVQAALAARGGVVWCDTLEQALAFANDYAPEHLLLAIPDPAAALARVRNAGAVFLGETSSVAFGDYATGANHTLPTGGAARAWSGLSTEQFVRWTSWQQVTDEGARASCAVAATLAELEGLPGHAAAARRADVACERVAATAGGPAPRGPRCDYAGLEPYPIEPGAGPDVLDLSDNTSRFGVSEAVAQAVRDCDAGTLARYPAREADVRAALARFADVPAALVTVGCGSDDLLDAAFRALASPGGTIAYGVPTFSMVPRFARANGLRAVEVTPRADGALDVDALLASGAGLVYVASPDNPTGRAHARADIERLLAGPAVVVLDHAYVEFAREDLTRLVLDHPRLVVTRTLSKAFGLAGLRIGWAAGRLAREIDKARGPFMVSAPAERAALAALAHDVDGMRARAAMAAALRERFADALRAAGFAPRPSDANFVLAPVADARAASATLARARIRVRAFRALPGVGDALRITIGPWPELECVLDALREVTPCA